MNIQPKGLSITQKTEAARERKPLQSRETKFTDKRTTEKTRYAFHTDSIKSSNSPHCQKHFHNSRHPLLTAPRLSTSWWKIEHTLSYAQTNVNVDILDHSTEQLYTWNISSTLWVLCRLRTETTNRR